MKHYEFSLFAVLITNMAEQQADPHSERLLTSSISLIRDPIVSVIRNLSGYRAVVNHSDGRQLDSSEVFQSEEPAVRQLLEQYLGRQYEA